jgi:acyl-CoA thioesterase YciA
MSKQQEAAVPTGDLAIRTLAMPANTNPNGDIFGGWVVSQMDLAGASVAYQYAKGRVTTAAIDAMSFLSPIYVGDFVCCYAKVLSVGRTSMQIHVEAWTISSASQVRKKVTEGRFTFVALNEAGRPRPVA